jgi:hypothetical protein
MAFWIEIEELTYKFAKIVEENLSSKKQLNDKKEREALHHPCSGLPTCGDYRP